MWNRSFFFLLATLAERRPPAVMFFDRRKYLPYSVQEGDL
jgi:hypothetical protein